MKNASWQRVLGTTPMFAWLSLSAFLWGDLRP